MRKKKEKDYELEQDLFAISKANRRVMIVFLIIMLALWCVPIYSLLKDSLKVHGMENRIWGCHVCFSIIIVI